MPIKNLERRKAYDRERVSKKYHSSPRELGRVRQAAVDRKIHVLSHYGPDGHLQCSWPECFINDVDMLTLDHVCNDGASHRREVKNVYCMLIREGFPDGYQTLCWNHQWKKEILRRREL